MVKTINQHILSCNLNYGSEIAVKLMASKVVATTRGSLYLHSFHGKKKKKEKKSSVIV